jgi:predicted tellurium resistance membrane protein TerC
LTGHVCLSFAWRKHALHFVAIAAKRETCPVLDFFSWVGDPAGWAALVTLTVMEIVLGIDNVVFISVLTSRLPPEQAHRARQLGLAMALIFRVALLFALTSIMRLTSPVIEALGVSLSWRDIILLVGGLFLIGKATHEIHAEIEGEEAGENGRAQPNAFGIAIVQIALIDMVFSVDSIVTAIGMAQDIGVMVTAVIISMIVMYLAAGAVSRFISRHPTTKTLALAFLILIGVALCADAFGAHIPRGYIYFAMAFAAGIEIVNIMIRRRNKVTRGQRRAAFEARETIRPAGE